MCHWSAPAYNSPDPQHRPARIPLAPGPHVIPITPTTAPRSRSKPQDEREQFGIHGCHQPAWLSHAALLHIATTTGPPQSPPLRTLSRLPVTVTLTSTAAPHWCTLPEILKMNPPLTHLVSLELFPPLLDSLGVKGAVGVAPHPVLLHDPGKSRGTRASFNSTLRLYCLFELSGGGPR